MKKSDLKNIIQEEIENMLNGDITPISDLGDVVPFLNANKEKIFQIADEYKEDTMSMQAALNNFLAPYIENTPEFIVTRMKAAIGSAILRRNVAANPKSQAAYDELKNTLNKRNNPMNESFLKMQKLAGVITEAQYNQKKKALVETQINEEKDINEFGKSLMDKLKKSGFDAKFVDNEVKKIELEKIVKDNPKKLAVVYFDKAINYVSIITNKDNQDEALKIAESSKSLLPDGYTVSKQGGYFVQIQPSLR